MRTGEDLTKVHIEGVAAEPSADAAGQRVNVQAVAGRKMCGYVHPDPWGLAVGLLRPGESPGHHVVSVRRDRVVQHRGHVRVLADELRCPR